MWEKASASSSFYDGERYFVFEMKEGCNVFCVNMVFSWLFKKSVFS